MSRTDEGERLNLGLPPDTTKKLNQYCMKVANKHGKMPWGIKTKIARQAIDEWLDAHGDDLDLMVEE